LKSILKKIASTIPKAFLKLVPDAIFVRAMFYLAYGRLPDLKNPVTFDEKIQWYKLKYRKPILARLSDKVEVREYIKEIGYGHILNDIYFIKDRLDAKDFKNLPEEYVLKANHGCGLNIIKDSNTYINIDEAVKTMNQWLGENYFYHGREWAYKNIKPKVMCERYLENKEYGELIDYKFYCYNGKPEVLFICGGRFSEEGVKYNAYDMDWKRILVTKGKESLDFNFDKPKNLRTCKKKR
jgi:hypothetical protein